MATTRDEIRVERVRTELVHNILQFWMSRVVDREHGGFYGLIDENGHVDGQSPRASVVNTRILWTFSAATRVLGEQYRSTADRAYDYILKKFWDMEQGGLFWMLDWQGNPISERKQTYGQAFGIYAFAEYFRASGEPAAAETAKRLFRLLEEHCHDRDFRGYVEALGRQWQPLADMRLSEKDLNCPKSMNTHLHVMEAYTGLLRLWRDDLLEARQAELLDIMLDRIVDSGSGHLRLFFDQQWNSVSPHVSYGHDIEASWLLVEAAEVLGDAKRMERAREHAMKLATAVLQEGVDRDGSVFYEADGSGALVDSNKHWWVQAEAVVGFTNAYQISGDQRFRTAASRVWDYIEAKVVDRVHGEWHSRLSRDGVPLTAENDPETYLVGPWKCPYHSARACLEMIERLRPG